MDINHNNNEKVLTLRAVDMRLCMSIPCIEKIIQLPHLDYAPSLAPGYVGILNYRGASIPIFDLYALLTGDRKDPYQLSNSIIIMKSEKYNFGIIVDEIYGIEVVDRQSIQLLKDFNSDMSYIYGSIVINNEVHMVLKMNFANMMKHVNEMLEDVTRSSQ